MADLFHRVSIRKYQDRPVEREKIVEILRAAMAAPSAKNQQPWEFYVITKKDTLEKLSKASPYAGMTANAPVAIISYGLRQMKSDLAESGLELLRSKSG